MKKFYGIMGVCLLLLSNMLVAQDYQLDFVGQMSFATSANGCGNTDTTGGSDVWGYVAPDGSEYALVGVKEGVAIVRIPSMELVELIPGPQNNDCYYHRDIQTYGHYAYIVAEMTGTNQGMMIVDLSPLPDSVSFLGSYTNNGSNVTSHNMHIDVNTGYAYIQRPGVRVVDLADPINPVDVAVISAPSVHDVYARNDTVYISEGGQGSVSIWDASDKSNITLLNRINIPSAGYVHNAWPTDDGKYLMTTEETTNKTVKMWDIQDISNIELKGQYLGGNNLAHNAHIMGDLAFISHYSYGVAVVDISDPNNLVEVATYDTHPATNASGFDGNWGAYPYSPNGYVFASDFESKLTVLQFSVTTGIDDPKPTLAQNFSLDQNYPNPFNPSTTIRYTLPEAGQVTLTLFDALGRQINTLVSEAQQSGAYLVQWNGLNKSGEVVPSGIYFYRLTFDGNQQFQQTRQMLFIK